VVDFTDSDRLSSMKFFRISIILFVLACTNLGFDQLNNRVQDNLSGSVTAPKDITVSNPTSFTFTVLGDTHIGSSGGGVAQRVVANAVAAGDAFAVVAGDLSQGGQDGEFTQFKQIFAAQNLTFRAAIGNHDIYFGGWDRYKVQIGRSIYSFNAGNVHFLMADTANGVLGQDQLDWMEQDLSRSNATHKIVITHFPPWNGNFSSIYKMSSEEEAAILKDMVYRYGVKFVFAGHFHGYNEADIGGTKYIVTGGANDIIDIGQKMNFVRVTVNGASISSQVIYLQ